MKNPVQISKSARIAAVRMVHRARSSHIGSCFSAADILGVLYGQVLRHDPRQPDWPLRDRLVISKGHAAAIVYAILAEVGYFPTSWLDHFCENGGRLAGHVGHKDVPGVEFSTGALGHGLSLGCGLALAAKADRLDTTVYVLLSDGECDEGSIWEAAMFASHHQLDNLVAIVDFNKIQSFGTTQEVLGLEPFGDKWSAFGWNVREVDGHDHDALARTLSLSAAGTQPRALIAHTVKGKGVSFMEHQLLWHYRSPSDEQLQQAIQELEHEDGANRVYRHAV